MQVSSINSTMAFKARVESTSPLVNGDWLFIQDKPAQPVNAAPKKESHWIRNTLLWVAGIAVATAAFVGLRNTKAIGDVMNAGGFKAQGSIGKKALWCLGKVGDWAKSLKGVTWDKAVGFFSKNKEKVNDVAENLAETVTEATV